MKLLSPTVALFDLDYTLLDGDSEAMWSRFLFEKGIVDRGFVQHMMDYYHAYDEGHLDIHAYESYLLQPMTTLPPEQLQAVLREFLERLRPAIRHRMMRRVSRFRTAGFTLLMITATNSFIAEPLAAMLRFPHLICTRVRQKDGRLTTELDGVPAFREGKVQRLDQWLDSQGLSLRGSWGYSDSHNDLQLLNRVEHPVAVRPDPVLRAHARQHGWKIIND